MRSSLFFRAILGIFIVSVFSFSCKDKEETGPSMVVTPSSLVLSYQSGDLIEFRIRGTAGDNELRNVQITQKPEGGITSVLKDTTLYGDECDFFYVYHVPSGNPRILLVFKLFDTSGKSLADARDLYVESGAYLAESTGFELYSPFFFGSNNAFHIAGLDYLQLDTDPDSSLVDMVAIDDLDDEMISRNLISYSGIKFVRNNAFNYGEATASSAQNNYVSSTPQQLITNLQTNDILITEYDTTLHKFAVIKVTGVFDDTGETLDRYIFNVKK